MCWVVFSRDKMTTGTPSSMFRNDLRKRSRKFEKFETQPTNAGSRLMAMRPAVSSCRSRSFSFRSTVFAYEQLC